MFTLPLLHELYRHLEWAECQVWTSALRSPTAIDDRELTDRLHHVHMTQRAFLELWTDQPIGHYRDQRFASLRELYEWALPYYGQVGTFLDSLDAEQLATPVLVPWSKFFVSALGREAASTTLGETIYQVTAHSHYHRAQVNTRLRALGEEPPLVDYIAWLWLGRPAPEWPDASDATSVS